LGTKINTEVFMFTTAATLLMLGVATVSLTTTIFAQQNSNMFTAILSGNNEVPPVTTTGSGVVIFQLSAVGHQLIINYQLNLINMSGVMGAHIYNGKLGENGPAVASLFNPSMRGPTGAINGQLSAATLTSSNLTGPLAGKQISDLVNIIRIGGAYVNVRTTQNQNGEVRGQIS
jgi:CHRD domain